MSGFKGKKNRYTCRSCNHSFVTIDRDDGTTPFTTDCQQLGCTGLAQSEFYRVDQGLAASHEWYRATDAEVARKSPGSRQHHQMGGLFLRRIPEGGA